MIQHLYQIIYCSEREGRTYRREIAVSHSGDMMVTNVETLPPFYDQAMERFRDDQEAVVGIAGGLSFLKPEFRGCPFCANQSVYCCRENAGGCGAYSCLSRDADHHACPKCGTLSGIEPSSFRVMSSSGFTGKGGGRIENPAPRTGGLPAGRPYLQPVLPPAPKVCRIEAPEGREIEPPSVREIEPPKVISKEKMDRLLGLARKLEDKRKRDDD